eukprot:642519-Rhodomonas_salina.1
MGLSLIILTAISKQIQLQWSRSTRSYPDSQSNFSGHKKKMGMRDSETCVQLARSSATHDTGHWLT